MFCIIRKHSWCTRIQPEECLRYEFCVEKKSYINCFGVERHLFSISLLNNCPFNIWNVWFPWCWYNLCIYRLVHTQSLLANFNLRLLKTVTNYKESYNQEAVTIKKNFAFFIVCVILCTKSSKYLFSGLHSSDVLVSLLYKPIYILIEPYPILIVEYKWHFNVYIRNLFEQ